YTETFLGCEDIYIERMFKNLALAIKECNITQQDLNNDKTLRKLLFWIRRDDPEHFLVKIAQIGRNWKKFFDENFDDYGRIKPQAIISPINVQIFFGIHRKESVPLHLLLELTYGEDKSTYLYTLYIPKKELQNKEFSLEFDTYLRAQIYNLLTSRGATRLGINVELGEEFTKRVVLWAKNAFFNGTKPLRQSHLPPRLSSVYGKTLEIYELKTEDIERYKKEEKEKEEESQKENVQKELSKQTEQIRQLSRLNIGIDAGGTDIKINVFNNGEDIFEKEHRWNPREFTTTELHLEAIVSLIKIGVIAKILLIDKKNENSDDIKKLKDELEKIKDPNTTIEQLKSFIEKAEKQLKPTYSQINSIGISWPDTVIEDRVISGANKVENVGVYKAVKRIVEKLRLKIEEEELKNLKYSATKLKQLLFNYLDDTQKKEFERLVKEERRKELEEFERLGELVRNKLNIDVPIGVINDGNVGAFWAYVLLGKGNILADSFGTSRGAGYINPYGKLTVLFTDMGNLIINLTKDREASHTKLGLPGVASKHLSQQGVFRVAKSLGINLENYRIYVAEKFAQENNIDITNIPDNYKEEYVYTSLKDKDEDKLKEYEKALESDAEKLKYVQSLLDSENNELRTKAEQVFKEIGKYVAYNLSQIFYYFDKKGIDYYILFGRVTKGKAGRIILESARRHIIEFIKDYIERIKELGFEYIDENDRQNIERKIEEKLEEIENQPLYKQIGSLKSFIDEIISSIEQNITDENKKQQFQENLTHLKNLFPQLQNVKIMLAKDLAILNEIKEFANKHNININNLRDDEIVEYVKEEVKNSHPEIREELKNILDKAKTAYALAQAKGAAYYGYMKRLEKGEEESTQSVSEIFDNTQGYDVIIVTVKDERKREEVEEVLNNVFKNNKNKEIYVIVENWPGGAGNLLGTSNAYKKAKELSKNSFENKKVAIFHNAGEGRRIEPLALSEGNDRGSVKMIGKVKDCELTLLLSVIANSEKFSSDNNAVDVFWVNQLYFENEKINSATNDSLISLFVTECKEDDFSYEEWEKLNKKELVIFEIDDNGKIVDFIEENIFEDLKEAKEFLRGKKLRYDLGAHRIKKEFLEAMLEFCKKDLRWRRRKLEFAMDFLQPLLVTLKGLNARSVDINNLNLENTNLFSLLPEKFRGRLKKFENYKEVIRFLEWLYKNKGNLFKKLLESQIGTIDRGKGLWLRFRRPLDVLSERLNMIADWTGGKITVFTSGVYSKGILSEEIIKQAKTLREFRGVKHPITNCVFGEIEIKGDEIKEEDIKRGIWINGIYIKGSLLKDSSFEKGSRIINSVVSNSEGKFELENSYVESSQIQNLRAKQSLIYKVKGLEKGKDILEIKGMCVADVERVGLE
ncbi:MAG: hypothetical protein DRP68_06460, partial [Candidatus Omnitrophota bacterium]